MEQITKERNDKVHALLISHIKKILGNKSVDAVGIACGTVDAVSSLSDQIIYTAILGFGFGKSLAPKNLVGNLLAISVNNEELSIIKLGKMSLDNLSINPILTVLSSGMIISKDIETFPVTGLSMKYNNENYVLSIQGRPDISVNFPDFIDYSNVVNAQEIVQVVKNEKSGKQIPASSFGDEINHVPADIQTIYHEAGACITSNAFTASVLCCRKIVMHIAVEKGDEPGKSFAAYVDFFEQKHYIPPDGKDRVDRIRQKGNEADHEIRIMSRDDAKDVLKFVEMLLKIMYEYPEERRRKNAQ